MHAESTIVHRGHRRSAETRESKESKTTEARGPEADPEDRPPP